MVFDYRSTLRLFLTRFIVIGITARLVGSFVGELCWSGDEMWQIVAAQHKRAATLVL